MQTLVVYSCSVGWHPTCKFEFLEDKLKMTNADIAKHAVVSSDFPDFNMTADLDGI